MLLGIKRRAEHPAARMMGPSKQRGVGFEPTSDLDDHCRFSRLRRFGSGRAIAGGE